MLQHIKILSPIILIFYSFVLSQVKLEVNTIPTKVDIHLDGVNLGSSPIKNERITPGVHKFEIKKKGYAPLTYDLLVNPAQAISLDFFLNPIYECKFKTEEKGLVFELNGEHRWDVDMVRLRLEAGDHLLRVFKIGEIIDEQTIRVDQPKKYNYFLKKPLASN
ncbi:hypothetical protein Ct9H90mP29_00670 [bacterium]|jgi:hypothetical protein|nr:MAG: hypothetical protein Ct9H90mP29_00670 [bacterium]